MDRHRLGGNNVKQGEADAEDGNYQKAVQEFDSPVAMRFCSPIRRRRSNSWKILEDLIGMRNQYAQGQNIGDACRDPSFAGTCIDLTDNVMSLRRASTSDFRHQRGLEKYDGRGAQKYLGGDSLYSNYCEDEQRLE